MKTCMVWGDMSADSAADQYPSVSVCDECIADDAKSENPQIVSIEGGFDSAYGDECHFCDKSIDDENDEQGHQEKPE
jgi:hypothetical protein